MSAVKFLQEKGILSEGGSKWVVKFEDCRIVDIVTLLEDFIKFESKEKEHNDKLLTVEYLIEQHPHISVTNAKDLLNFANSKTCTYKTCYGNGSIIYPKWDEAMKEREFKNGSISFGKVEYLITSCFKNIEIAENKTLFDALDCIFEIDKHDIKEMAISKIQISKLLPFDQLGSEDIICLIKMHKEFHYHKL